MSKWKKIKIGELLTRYKEPVDIQDGVVYNRVTIKTKHKGVKIRDQEIGAKIGTKKQWKVKEGQFILSRIDARFGALGMIPKEVDGSIVTNDFLAFDVNENILKKYLFLQLLKSPIFLDACRKASRGVTQRKRVDEDFLLNYEITIPQIERQEKIVRMIQNSETKCKQLDLKNYEQKAVLKELRAQILQDAISGRLTAEWRTQNPDTESSSKLFEQIKAEKEKLIAEKKIKKEKPLPKIAETEVPFELPEGWEWCRLGEIIHISSGDFLPSHQMAKDGKIPVFGGNGINGYHDIGNIDEEKIVIGRVGAYCGCVHLTPKNAWVTDNAFTVNYPQKHLDKDWLILLLKNMNLGKSSYNGAQPVISGKRVYPLVSPLAPRAEQRAIVAKVERLMWYVSQLEGKIAQNAHDTEILMQAFLAESFKS